MMANLQIRKLPTAEEIARTAARDLVGLLKRRGDLSVPFGIALSGGRIAKSFYEAVVAVATPEDMASVHFFWADERCVPPSDPENNYAIARTSLFQPLRVPEDQIHSRRGRS
jgi:6-phosphogluconolactonase